MHALACAHHSIGPIRRYKTLLPVSAALDATHHILYEYCCAAPSPGAGPYSMASCAGSSAFINYQPYRDMDVDYMYIVLPIARVVLMSSQTIPAHAMSLDRILLPIGDFGCTRRPRSEVYASSLTHLLSKHHIAIAFAMRAEACLRVVLRKAVKCGDDRAGRDDKHWNSQSKIE